MGGRSRRHQGCRDVARLARRDARARLRLLRRGVVCGRASRRCASRRQNLARGGRACRGLGARRRSAIWKPPRKAMPSSRQRLLPGPAPALDRLKAVWDGPVAYPVAVATAASGHGIALEAALSGLPAGGSGQLGLGRRAAHSFGPDGRAARSGRARADYCGVRPACAFSEPGRHRLLGFPRRSRRQPARDAVHAAVPVLKKAFTGLLTYNPTLEYIPDRPVQLRASSRGV